MLPFILGIAAGAAAVVAINNRKEIKERVVEGAEKVKETAKDIKESIGKKVGSPDTKVEASGKEDEDPIKGVHE